MSVRLRPVLHTDGCFHATIRVAFHPDLDEVVTIVARDGDPDGARPLSYTALHELLTQAFHEHGAGAGFTDLSEYPDSEWSDRTAWAWVQVKRLYPAWRQRNEEAS